MSVRNLLRLPDGRLGAPLRIIAFLVIAMAAYLVATVLGDWTAIAAGAFGLRLIVYAWAGLVALLGAHAVMLWLFERGAPWSTVGLGRENASPRLLATGLVVGALAIGVPSVILLLTRQLAVAHSAAGSWWDAALRTTAFLLPAAFVEELFLRGYLFTVLRELVGWKWTLIGTSVAFGVLHLRNPGATAESTLLVIIAGFFLGAIVLATKSVYAAWMAHFAWNWTLVAAMHAAVSGISMSAPNYQVIDNGPDWLTGGTWGPEGGFAAGVSLFVFTLFLFGRYLNTIPPRTGTPLHDASMRSPTHTPSHSPSRSQTLDART